MSKKQVSGNKKKEIQKTEKKQNNTSKNASKNINNSKKVAEKKSATKKQEKKKIYTREETIKKQNKIKKIIKVFILFSILIGIGIFLSTSEMFNIIDIQISGNEQVMAEELEIDDKIGSNIFLLTKSQIRNDIKKNPYIKYVYIKKILPNKLVIKVEEREKAFMIKNDNTYIYLDKQGYILEKTEINFAKIIILGYTTNNFELGQRLNEKDLKKLEDIIRIIENCKEIEINDKITSINILDSGEYIVYIQEMKKMIYIGDTTNLANKMLYIKAILKKEDGKEGKIFLNGNFSEGFQAYFREEANQIDI